MKIAIAARYRPYSFQPGIRTPIPGTDQILTAYPTLLQVGSREVPLHVTGPVRAFQVELDLERGCVAVSGKAPEGFFRLRVEADRIVWERGPRKGETLAWSEATVPPRPPERLSLGCSKQLEWEQVWRRMDLRELAPLFFALAQWVPLEVARACSFTEEFVRAAFRGMMVPTLVDDLHQGLPSLQGVAKTPTGLIKAAGSAIRAALIEWREGELHLLPALPRDWIVGRLTGIVLPELGTLDLEWTRSLPRRAILHAQQSGTVSIALPKPLQSCRVRTSEADRGHRITDRFEVIAGQTYLLDRFQK